MVRRKSPRGSQNLAWDRGNRRFFRHRFKRFDGDQCARWVIPWILVQVRRALVIFFRGGRLHIGEDGTRSRKHPRNSGSTDVVLCSRISFVSESEPSTPVGTGFFKVCDRSRSALKSPELRSALRRVDQLTCEVNLT